MTSVEFQATVENGAIIVPEAYRQQLADGATVKVIVLQPQASSWQELSPQFRAESIAAGYDSREKVLALIQAVKQEMAAERDQCLSERQTDISAS
jgi:hypothetical protein